MATLTSSNAGNFSSAATWGGTAPSTGDTFTINHHVKYDINNTGSDWGTITVNSAGMLWFPTDQSTYLRISGDLANAGLVQTGSPNKTAVGSAYTCTIAIECVSNGQYGIKSNSGGKWYLYGYDLPITYSHLKSTPSAAQNQIELTDDITGSDWLTGNYVYLYSTEKKCGSIFDITAISGSVLTLGSNITSNSSAGLPVLYLNRNVKLQSYSEYYHMYGQILQTGTNSGFDFDNVEFFYVGDDNNYSKKGLTLACDTAGSFRMNKCSLWQGYNQNRNGMLLEIWNSDSCVDSEYRCAMQFSTSGSYEPNINECFFIQGYNANSNIGLSTSYNYPGVSFKDCFLGQHNQLNSQYNT
jgi:hypothetical protein